MPFFFIKDTPFQQKQSKLIKTLPPITYPLIY